MVNAFKKPPQAISSILIVKLDEIGDMIYTLHCIESLSQLYPNATMDVYCKPMNNDLVKQTGAVTQVINDPASLKNSYDIQIDFRGNWDSLKRALLGKCRYYLDRGSIRLKNKFHGGQKHEIDTNQETIQWLFPQDHTWQKPKLNIAQSDIAVVEELLRSHSVDKYVVMHCGAREESRRWPTERFAELITHIFDKYQLKSVLIGAPNESELNEKVCNQTPYAINLAGKTNLLQLAALIRSAVFFVGNESGPLHFAIVEQKPLVALFGPGVQDVFYPLYPNQKVIHHVNDKTPQEDKLTSMSLIQTTEVIEALIDLPK